MMYVKGHVISHIPQFLKERFGDEELLEWESSLSHQAFDIYSHGIDKAGWYPLRLTMIEPINNACKMFYRNSLIGATEFGRYLAWQEKRKERWTLPFKTGREAQLKKACSKLQSHFETSEVHLKSFDDRGATIRVCRFSEIDDVIEAVLAGWIQKNLEYGDRKVHDIEVASSSSHGRCVEYALRWNDA